MKTKILGLLFLPLCSYASIYHETVELPSECYATNNHIPDPVNVMSKCFAIADYYANRSMKDQTNYFKSNAPGCINVNLNLDTLPSVVCADSYLNYQLTYSQIKSVK